jgi:hypothetical protein
MTRIALFNDTGRYPHVGCRGVSSGHDRMLHRLGISVVYRSFHGEWQDFTSLRESPLADHLDGVDAVVVNGEGTIHHQGGRHLLAILREAQAIGLQTFLVNAVFQDAEQDLGVLNSLTDFTVRDAASSAYLTRLGVKHRVVLDSILEADFVDRAFTDLRGKIAVTDWHTSRDGDVGAALRRFMDDLGDDAVFYPLEGEGRADRWQHAVADFRTASLVVTGRHHGVCLAGLAGVPLVAMGSYTWKIEGMLALMAVDLKMCRTLAELPDTCIEMMGRPEVFAAIRDFLVHQRPLSTFEVLGRTVRWAS